MSDLTMAQACLRSLLHTATKASLLFLPSATKRSKSALHAALVFLAGKLHINSLLQISPPPMRAMRDLPRTLVSELYPRGQRPAFTISCRQVSIWVNPLANSSNIAAVLRPIPGMEHRVLLKQQGKTSDSGAQVPLPRIQYPVK